MAMLNRISIPATCFSFPKPHSRAALRLFCFPYAGGGASMCYSWPEGLPAEVETVAVNLPGRGHRMSERAFSRMEPLVSQLACALLPFADKPFAFFGHSMGALVAFEVCREVRRQYGLQPAALFVSGCVAPQDARLTPRLRDLSDSELKKRLRYLGGAPDEMLQNSQLMSLMLPTLRADFSVCETYEHRDDPPLDCPITAYGGLQDTGVGYETLEGWRRHTSSQFALHLLRGGHFFIQTAEPLFLETLSRDLAQHCAEESCFVR